MRKTKNAKQAEKRYQHYLDRFVKKTVKAMHDGVRTGLKPENTGESFVEKEVKCEN